MQHKQRFTYGYIEINVKTGLAPVIISKAHMTTTHIKAPPHRYNKPSLIKIKPPPSFNLYFDGHDRSTLKYNFSE